MLNVHMLAAGMLIQTTGLEQSVEIVGKMVATMSAWKVGLEAGSTDKLTRWANFNEATWLQQLQSGEVPQYYKTRYRYFVRQFTTGLNARGGFFALAGSGSDVLEDMNMYPAKLSWKLRHNQLLVTDDTPHYKLGQAHYLRWLPKEYHAHIIATK